jgi:hypothetical protein
MSLSMFLVTDSYQPVMSLINGMQIELSIER